MSSKHPIPPELEDVVSQIGEFIEYWGFKNVHGRIWAHLYLSESPLDAGDLIERLGISKALVSMSLADLMEYDVIELAGKSQHGTQTYRSNPNVVSVVMGVLRKRERRLLSRISAATKLLKDKKSLISKQAQAVDLNTDRIDSLHQMVLTAEDTLDAVLDLGDLSLGEWEQFDEGK